ncbi:integrase core domain-containing protein [Jannaschia formosa]|uniref:integrase core domain-containing protein n=1 Tax=Jannaschia formosa TaxID=2259592 RepID=UPI000E1C1EDF|nr:integrase core domain-containing protein [Jannaschia formosa]TFL18697.1 hypothetical protein DR046_07150 [Jannaschia formosa]
MPCRARDNGIQFTNRKKDKYAFIHAFGIAYTEHDIKHQLTKVNHAWMNRPVERMNRTIKEATVRRYHHGSRDKLRTHRADFVAAYNFARRLKTFCGLTSKQYVVKCRTDEPDRFKINPRHQMPAPDA